jgi:hypothetical protein
MKNNEKVGHYVMNPQNMITDKEQKVLDDISTMNSKIAELHNILQKKELGLVKMEKKAKGLKTYLISWMKYYWAGGEKEIEAPTEEEAIQIARDNIGGYDGHMEWDYDKNFIESWGEVKE